MYLMREYLQMSAKPKKNYKQQKMDKECFILVLELKRLEANNSSSK